ncbi:unnamed protein product [Cyprideis torosa]|uniref:peptidylprolyl isomerase n=1 Tax=Cyprideis torosa TaxID=163714 RepID=A0A7R8W385_9CRUS|nr:unnamed protein product [Cyprideis torosa]CAG0882764.1 unnamed protein product [Cyprideis torosa]
MDSSTIPSVGVSLGIPTARFDVDTDAWVLTTGTVANPSRESEDAEILCDLWSLGRLRKFTLTEGTSSNFPIYQHVVEVKILGPFACGYPARDNYHLVPGLVGSPTGRVYFVIGDWDLTEGLDCAIEHMKIGETAKIFLDPGWAYGKLGRPDFAIPPYSELILFSVSIREAGFIKHGDRQGQSMKTAFACAALPCYTPPFAERSVLALQQRRTPKILLVRETRASDASALEWSSLGPEIGLVFLGELARSSHSSDRIGVLKNRGSCLHLLRTVDNGNHR